VNRSDNISALATALVAAQAELKNPPFDSKNPHYKNEYASLQSVRDTVTPILTRHGLTVSQLLSSSADGPVCETVLLHKTGEYISSTLCLPVDRDNAQGYGSAFSYARRYALMAIVNVVGEKDDDAEAAIKPLVVNSRSRSTNAIATAEINEEQKLKCQLVINDVREHLPTHPEDAYLTLENANLDSDEKTWVWNFFDSSERSAIKAGKAKITNKE